MVFFYVPFLFYYHAAKEYYHDYWRFTEDGIRLLFNDFSKIEVKSVRGATETWLHLSPLGHISILARTARIVDYIFGKVISPQVSGFYIFLIK